MNFKIFDAVEKRTLELKPKNNGVNPGEFLRELKEIKYIDFKLF